MFGRAVLLFGATVGAAALAASGLVVIEPDSAAFATKGPIRTVVLNVDPNSVGPFLDRLRDYGGTVGLETWIDPGRLRIQMWDDEVEIIGGASPFVVNEVDLSFYSNGRETLPISAVDDLIVELRRTLADFTGATITRIEPPQVSP